MLLGQLYAAFNEKLRGRFDARYPPNEWAFDVFIEFLTHEISYIDSLHHMQVDFKDTPKWKESEKQRLVPWPNKRLPHKQVASVVERNKQHTALGGDPPENIKEFKRCPIHPEANSHHLWQCRSFANMPTDERWTVAEDCGICLTALKKSMVLNSAN